MLQKSYVVPPTARSLTFPWRDYLAMTKPRVIALLLLTTLTSMFMATSLAREPLPSWSTLMLTLLGGYLAAGGAGVLNCYLDRDIDANMGRTSRRPLPAQRIQPQSALIFGLALCGLSVVVLWVGANLLAALLALAGIVLYVGVYTCWLKRWTTQNIVWGGAAGAIPPLVGWAAAAGELALLPWLLFAIIFCWTPPHFWALALVRRYDYARAGVPMLPVVLGEAVACEQIVRYTLVTVALSLLPFTLGYLGKLYLVAGLALGQFLLAYALQLQRQPSTRHAWRLYKFSLLYLALLFVVMVLDLMLT
jgi:protoheme IX farnesyltransferase